MLVFPQLFPRTEDLTLVDDTTSVFTSAFGSGLTQRVARQGPRWHLHVTYESLSQQHRHNLLAFCSRVRGRALSFFYTPRHSTLRGTFPASELLGNVAFDTVNNWTASAELALYADANRIRLTRTAVVADRYVNADQTTGLTNGAAYLVRGTLLTGKGPSRWGLRVGSTVGAADYMDTGTLTAAGGARASNTIAATTAYVSLYDHNTGKAAGDYASFDGVSFARCIRVNGAPQTGNALNVKNLPASTNGLLVAGDVVSIYSTQWELKRLTAALNGDASGLGYLQFESSLRGAPADSAPIAVHAPSAKFILASDIKIKTQAGMYSDVDLDLVEVTE